MDENTVLQKNTEVISEIINEYFFGKLSIMIGNNNTFLGMNIVIKDSTIQVDMVKQLEECIEIFGEDVSTLVTSPETKNFLK